MGGGFAARTGAKPIPVRAQISLTSYSSCGWLENFVRTRRQNLARYLHLRGWRIPPFPRSREKINTPHEEESGEKYEQSRDRCCIDAVVLGLRVLTGSVKSRSGAGIESKLSDRDQQRRPGRGEHRHRRFLSGVDLEPHQRNPGSGAERE